MGDRRRDAVPAPVTAGDDAVIDRARTLDRAVLERRAPPCGRRDWLLVLEPDASEALRLAALTHDMERHFPGGPVPDLTLPPEADVAYRREHSERSARIVGEWLRGEGAPETTIAEVERLIRLHEVGGDHDADVLQAADSLSFLEVNVDVPYAWARRGDCDLERARAQHAWMFERIKVPAAAQARRAALRGGAPPWRLTGWPRPRSRRRSRSGPSTGTTQPSWPEGRFSRSSSTSGSSRRRSCSLCGASRGSTGSGPTASSVSERSSRTARSSAPRSCASGWPAVAHVFSVVASPRIRNQATVGGVLGDADYASDPPAMLSALGARVVVQSARGTRELPVEELIVGHYETSLERRRADHRGRRPGATPTAPSTGSSAHARTRIARASASRRPRPRTACAWSSEPWPGRRSSSPTLCRLADPAEIGQAYAEAIEPIADVRGSADYRRRVIAVEVRRAVEEVAMDAVTRSIVTGTSSYAAGWRAAGDAARPHSPVAVRTRANHLRRCLGRCPTTSSC